MILLLLSLLLFWGRFWYQNIEQNMVPQFHFAGGTHAMVRQPATSIPHDLPTEFLRDTVGETLLLAEGQHRAWSSMSNSHQLYRTRVGLAWLSCGGDSQEGWIPTFLFLFPNFASFEIQFQIQLTQLPKCHANSEWEKKNLGFFTLAKQGWRTCSLLRVKVIFQSLLPTHRLTHPKIYITQGKKTNHNNQL